MEFVKDINGKVWDVRDLMNLNEMQHEAFWSESAADAFENAKEEARKIATVEPGNADDLDVLNSCMEYRGISFDFEGNPVEVADEPPVDEDELLALFKEAFDALVTETPDGWKIDHEGFEPYTVRTFEDLIEEIINSFNAWAEEGTPAW